MLAVGLIFMRPSEKSFVPKPRCTALGCLFSSDSRPNDQNTKRIPAEVDKPKDTFTIGGMTSFPFSETAIAYSGIYIYIYTLPGRFLQGVVETGSLRCEHALPSRSLRKLGRRYY